MRRRRRKKRKGDEDRSSPLRPHPGRRPDLPRRRSALRRAAMTCEERRSNTFRQRHGNHFHLILMIDSDTLEFECLQKRFIKSNVLSLLCTLKLICCCCVCSSITAFQAVLPPLRLVFEAPLAPAGYQPEAEEAGRARTLVAGLLPAAVEGREVEGLEAGGGQHLRGGHPGG